MQESTLGNPALLVHQLAVHDRDLAGRPPETDEAQFEPEPQRFAERHCTRRKRGR